MSGPLLNAKLKRHGSSRKRAELSLMLMSKPSRTIGWLFICPSWKIWTRIYKGGVEVKKRLSLLFVVLALFSLFSCNGPTAPNLPTKNSDVVELLYERVKPVVAPNGPDPKGFGLSSPSGSGIRPSWQQVGEGAWMGEAVLGYTYSSANPYRVNVTDGKTGMGSDMVQARKISARVKGQSEWIELTKIVPSRDFTCEEAVFLLDDKGIHAEF